MTADTTTPVYRHGTSRRFASISPDVSHQRAEVKAAFARMTASPATCQKCRIDST
ncbi:MAG: hypothetical protein QOC58_1212 [Mycobacterium sp.]|nr:hypothetical protein [Mycobacterium sp.]